MTALPGTLISRPTLSRVRNRRLGEIRPAGFSSPGISTGRARCALHTPGHADPERGPGETRWVAQITGGGQETGTRGAFPAERGRCIWLRRALTGYRLTTVSAGSIVDGAHIHQFSDSRNNDPRNGLALCKNAHWLFDNGLWTLADDYSVIVAAGRFSEDSPDQKPLSAGTMARGFTCLLTLPDSLIRFTLPGIESTGSVELEKLEAYNNEFACSLTGYSRRNAEGKSAQNPLLERQRAGPPTPYLRGSQLSIF